MTQFTNPIKPITDSAFGQLVIQSGTVTASTAIRLAGVTLCAIMLKNVSDTVTRCLNQAPYIGWIAEKFNPALLVSRADRFLSGKCEEAALFLGGKFKWHKVDLLNEKDQEQALEHIQNQQYKASGLIKPHPKDDKTKEKTIEAPMINRILMISSVFKTVISIVAAALIVRHTFYAAEFISPGVETWNAMSSSLGIPVKITL